MPIKALNCLKSRLVEHRARRLKHLKNKTQLKVQDNNLKKEIEVLLKKNDFTKKLFK